MKAKRAAHSRKRWRRRSRANAHRPRNRERARARCAGSFRSPSISRAARVRVYHLTRRRNSARHYRKGHTVKVITYKSHKGGQGTTVTACASALALAQVGHRVALVSNDPDTRGALALPAGVGTELTTEVTRGLHLLDVAALDWQQIDARALAALVGLADDPRPFDVIVTDLHDETPTAATLDAHGFTAHAVEVVTADYLALRRSTMAAHAGAERRQHVVLIVEDGRALTTADVRSVLAPAGDLVEVKRTAAVARQIDAGVLAHRLPADLAPLVEFAQSLLVEPHRVTAAPKTRRTAKGKTAAQ